MRYKVKNTTKKIIMAAMLAALTCVATMVIKIPSPLNGYINLGDCIVLLSGWLLSPLYGFMSAGLGSALADLFAGYVTYAPATFLIKGLMALIAFGGFRVMHKRLGSLAARVLSGITAEIVMILGYFAFEGFLYGFAASVVNIPANGVQGVAGMVLGVLLIKIFERNKIAV